MGDEDLLDRASKRLDFLGSMDLAQGRFWTPDRRRFGFDLVDYINSDDLANLDQFLNGLETTTIDSVDPSRVLDELDSLLTVLMQNLCQKTWQIDEPIRSQAAAMAANYRDQFVSIKAFDTARPAEQIQHLEVQTSPPVDPEGNKVFIGHGHAPAWWELKDFIQNRLHLQCEEFNSAPVAGFTTVERLNAMLNDAGMAFLVLTAEDEDRSGQMVARQNVVHEVGLFQGRLGFPRAIVLLEDDCAEFSNIVGLIQLRFPKGRISAIFEDVRGVLEREGFLSP